MPSNNASAPTSAYISVIFVTAITTYPFLAVVQQLSDIGPQDFEPCSDECLFIRFFTSSHLPSTQVQNLDSTRVGSMWPAFALVQNGQNVTFKSYDPLHEIQQHAWQLMATVPYALFATISLLPSACINTLVHGQELYPSPVLDAVDEASDAHAFCDSDKMRAKIKNHLNGGITRVTYIVGLVGWGALKAVHDVALLSQRLTEKQTLTLGLASFAFQWMAAVSGVIWCVGAAEVFVAKVDGSEAACYYELSNLSLLIAVSQPVILIYTCHLKLMSLHKAVSFGDYLYAVTYDVPHRIVHATMGKHCLDSLLVAAVAGIGTEPAAPLQLLSREEFLDLAVSVHRITMCVHLTTVLINMPFMVCPVFVRLVVLCSRHRYGNSVYGMVKLATAAVAWGPVALVSKSLFLNLLELAVDRTRLRWSQLAPYLVLVTLIPAGVSTTLLLSSSIQDLLQLSWLCSACGFQSAAFAANFAYMKTNQAENCTRARVLAYTPEGERMELEKVNAAHLVHLVREHPEWHLDAVLNPANPSANELRYIPNGGDDVNPQLLSRFKVNANHELFSRSHHLASEMKLMEFRQRQQQQQPEPESVHH